MYLGLVGLALCSAPLLLFVQFNPFLVSWQSRKVLHMGTGTLYILSNVHDPHVRLGMYAVTALNVVGLFNVRTFHFADLKDVGIISYLLLCSLVAYLQIPFWHIAPMFYADPFGAIVGRTTRSAKLVGSKSVNGTLAVGVVAFLTLFDTDVRWRLVHAGVIAAIELFCGKWDNPAIGSYLVARHLLASGGA